MRGGIQSSKRAAGGGIQSTRFKIQSSKRLPKGRFKVKEAAVSEPHPASWAWGQIFCWFVGAGVGPP